MKHCEPIPHYRFEEEWAAGGRSLYKRHDNGAIWRYPDENHLCNHGVCPPWQLLYDPTVSTIVSSQN